MQLQELATAGSARRDAGARSCGWRSPRRGRARRCGRARSARNARATAAAVVRPEDDGDTPYSFDRPFEARGEIHRVAEHGIIVAPARADIADDAIAGVDADPDGEARRRALARLRGASSAFRAAHRLHHAQAPRATARSGWSGLGSGAFQNAITQSPMYLSMVPPSASTAPESGSSRRLMRRGEPLGLVLEALRQGREAAHVAEQDRQVAPLAAELEGGGIAGELRRRGPARDSARRPPTPPAAAAARARSRGRSRVPNTASARGGRQGRRRPDAAVAQTGSRRRATSPASRDGRRRSRSARLCAARHREAAASEAAAITRPDHGRRADTGMTNRRWRRLSRIVACTSTPDVEGLGRQGVGGRKASAPPAVGGRGAALQAQAHEDDLVLEAARRQERAPGRGPGNRTRSDRSGAGRNTGSGRPGAPAPGGSPPAAGPRAAKPSGASGIRRR